MHPFGPRPRLAGSASAHHQPGSPVARRWLLFLAPPEHPVAFMSGLKGCEQIGLRLEGLKPGKVAPQIGRAPGRESVYQYGTIPVVAVPLKTQTKRHNKTSYYRY